MYDISSPAIEWPMRITRPEVQTLDRRANVLDQPRRIVARRRMRRLAEAAARERDDMKAVGERGREVVERVRGVAESREKQHGRSAAAEVEIVQTNASA